MRKGHQRLLEPGHRCSKGRSLGRLGSGLAEIVHGLVPQLASERVMSEPVDVLGKPTFAQPLDGVDDLRMKGERRRSRTSLPYVTSCVSACLKEYSISGDSPAS